MKYDIFISYRREGGDTLAQLIYDRLTHRGYNVFLDIESLNNGKFNEKLLSVIDECKDLVVILPPNALDRCHNEGDWLFLELQHAIKLGKNIIPVMMNGFYFPENIPEEIAEIQYYNGIQDNKDYFDAVIDKITTLLLSKAAFGGGIFKKRQSRKVSIDKRIKNQKRMLITVLILLFCAAGAFFFMQHRKQLQKNAVPTYVEITLTPTEDMGATEYYTALDIVKERCEILADGLDFTFETTNEETLISLPLEVFHGIEVSQILQCYVTRPLALYLYDGEEYYAIDRDDIASVTYKKGPYDGFHLKDYEIVGLEEGEEYQYLDLKFADSLSDECKELLEKDDLTLKLVQDAELALSHYFYVIADSYTADGIQILDNYQYDNILNLIEYNYTHDTYSASFYFKIEYPIAWEDVEDETISVGKNQCNVDDLSGPLIQLLFSTYKKPEEISAGEFQDTVSILKARLDALNIPYSFGYNVQNPYTLGVKTDCSMINDQVIDLIIGSYAGVCVDSDFYTLLTDNYIEDVKVKETENGSYALVIEPSAYGLENIQTAIAEMTAQGEDPVIYLSDSSNVPFDETTLSECYDGNVFTFDSLTSFGLDSISEEYVPIFELLKVCTTGFDYPISYSLDTWKRENVEEFNNVSEFLKFREVVTEPCETYWDNGLSEILDKTKYELIVSSLGTYITVDIFFEDAPSAAEVNLIAQEINQRFDLLSGNTHYLYLHYKDANEQTFCTLTFSRNVYAHQMSMNGYYSEITSESFINDYEKILGEDSFYQQFYISDHDKDENGKLTFIN